MLINEFLKFLSEESVIMGKINWEIINGSKSILNLNNLIIRSCQELGLRCDKSGSTIENTCLKLKTTTSPFIYIYYIFDRAELFFAVTIPEKKYLELDCKKWYNNLGVVFNFDKYCFFHKSLEEQIYIMKEFITDLTNKVDEYNQLDLTN